MNIALTGGIACGKSLLCSFLNELGVATRDADDIVHELIPDPDERRRLAAEVFSDPVKRRALEARLHPLVRERLRAFQREGTAEEIRIAVIPLLFEVHWNDDYDIIACVVTSRDRQIERMMTTRGYTREQAEGRLAAQMPVDEKAQQSHYVIRNDGTADELRLEARRFVDWIRSNPKNRSNGHPAR